MTSRICLMIRLKMEVSSWELLTINLWFSTKPRFFFESTLIPNGGQYPNINWPPIGRFFWESSPRPTTRHRRSQNTGSASLTHHGSEGRRSHETAPKNCLMWLLKSYSKIKLEISSNFHLPSRQNNGIRQPQTPWQWRTKKPRNGAEKLPNVASEILEKQRFSTASEDSVSSEILEKQPFSTASVACGRCSKTASKKSPAGGKHRASEGRASSKTTPKNCLTSRLKS